jgi:hypothetical protein
MKRVFLSAIIGAITSLLILVSVGATLGWLQGGINFGLFAPAPPRTGFFAPGGRTAPSVFGAIDVAGNLLEVLGLPVGTTGLIFGGLAGLWKRKS